MDIWFFDHPKNKTEKKLPPKKTDQGATETFGGPRCCSILPAMWWNVVSWWSHGIWELVQPGPPSSTPLIKYVAGLIWLVATQIFWKFSPQTGDMIQIDEHIFPKGLKPPTSGRWTTGTYSHHPFRKEHDLNQTSHSCCSMLIFRGVPPMYPTHQIYSRSNLMAYLTFI